jgi:hypothetical protein
MQLHSLMAADERFTRAVSIVSLGPQRAGRPRHCHLVSMRVADGNGNRGILFDRRRRDRCLPGRFSQKSPHSPRFARKILPDA